MIIINLKGGLGNQMFQYALGRHLAEIYQCPLKISLDILRLYPDHPLVTSRNYELGAFQIMEYFDIPKRKTRTQKLLPSKFLKKYFSVQIPNQPKLILENRFSFQSSVFDQNPPFVLQGYWQSEQYFKDIAQIIRQEFTLKKELSAQAQKIQHLIETCTAIGVHIRRGDYLSNPNSKKFHGVCSLTYYAEAMAYIAKRVDDPVFFIFSDEPAWVLQHFHTPLNHQIIKHRENQPAYEDLWLMKVCKHQIIANSTYSWWAAWLNDFPDKIVISPQNWLLDEHTDTSDVVPHTWIKI